MIKMIKSYAEMLDHDNFLDRLEYLQCFGSVGFETFGSARYLNQALYTSYEWRQFRNRIILRDEGNDLALDGFPIHSRIIIHHINPLTPEDITNRASCIFDPNNVVCVSHKTHEAIHYGFKVESNELITRSPNDTKLWGG